MWQRKPWGLGGHNDVRLSSAFFVVNAWFESGLFGAHAYARSGSLLWCFPEVKSTSKDWKIGQNESKDQSYRCAGCATGSGKARACNLYGSSGKVPKKPCRAGRPRTRWCIWQQKTKSGFSSSREQEKETFASFSLRQLQLGRARLHQGRALLVVGWRLFVCCLFFVVGCWLSAVGFWLEVFGWWLFVVGCWLLVVGCWLLVVGCLLLVGGWWLVVVGWWLVVVGWCLLVVGWGLSVVGWWRLAVGCWLFAVGCLLVVCCWLVVGGWWLVVGGWWLWAGGWWLLVGVCWLLVGGCWLLPGGVWQLAVGCLLLVVCWLVVGGWLLLFVVCCLLFVVCCLLFVVCCLLFVVVSCCLLFAACCLFFVVVGFGVVDVLVLVLFLFLLVVLLWWCSIVWWWCFGRPVFVCFCCRWWRCFCGGWWCHCPWCGGVVHDCSHSKHHHPACYAKLCKIFLVWEGESALISLVWQAIPIPHLASNACAWNSNVRHQTEFHCSGNPRGHLVCLQNVSGLGTSNIVGWPMWLTLKTNAHLIHLPNNACSWRSNVTHKKILAKKQMQRTVARFIAFNIPVPKLDKLPFLKAFFPPHSPWELLHAIHTACSLICLHIVLDFPITCLHIPSSLLSRYLASSLKFESLKTHQLLYLSQSA